MKIYAFLLLVVISMGSVTKTNAQRNVVTKNNLGIYGGLTQFDIKTDNFITNPGQGWIGGLTARVELPHKWYTVSYNIQLAENTVGIMARPSLISTPQEIDFTMLTAQVAFLVHVKIIQEYLTIDVGPMIQYSGDLEVKDNTQSNYIIENYTRLTARDLYKISPFNINGAVGVSAGLSWFKVRGQYIYGFNNTLNQLNSEDYVGETNTSKFEGNLSMFALTAIITF